MDAPARAQATPSAMIVSILLARGAWRGRDARLVKPLEFGAGGREAHGVSANQGHNQNWLYCSIKAPRFGKRRITLSATNRPSTQKVTTAIR